MSISKEQKKLRNWLSKHGWKSDGEPYDWTFRSPVHHYPIMKNFNYKTRENQDCRIDTVCEISLSNYKDKITLVMYEKYVWISEDRRSDESEFIWNRTSITEIPAEDFLKISELVAVTRLEKGD